MLKFAVMLSAIVSLLFIAPLTYMALDTLPPYEYDAARSYVVPAHTAAGKQMLVHWHLTKVNRVCPGAVTRFIVDQKTGARISYDPSPAASNIEIGDLYLDRTFFLPPAITPGMKWYYSEGDYACNPLQRFYPLVVRTPRLGFEVTE